MRTIADRNFAQFGPSPMSGGSYVPPPMQPNDFSGGQRPFPFQPGPPQNAVPPPTLSFRPNKFNGQFNHHPAPRLSPADLPPGMILGPGPGPGLALGPGFPTPPFIKSHDPNAIVDYPEDGGRTSAERLKLPLLSTDGTDAVEVVAEDSVRQISNQLIVYDIDEDPPSTADLLKRDVGKKAEA